MCMSTRSRAPALSLHTLKSLCRISTNAIHSSSKRAPTRTTSSKSTPGSSPMASTTTFPTSSPPPPSSRKPSSLRPSSSSSSPSASFGSPSAAWALSRAPRSIPGTTGVVVALAGSTAHRALAGLAQALGATQLMAFSVGFTRFIVSSHPDTAKEILNSSAFADRPIKESAYELLFHRAIRFAPFGEYWRNLRRISATHLFSPKRIAAFSAHRQEIGRQMVEEMKALMGTEGVKRVLHSGL